MKRKAHLEKFRGFVPARTSRDLSANTNSASALRPELFPIVGVGASAGGLEAFQELLKYLPADTGMAFVLVQHLDPQHESALTHLLARGTTMPVREVTHNLRVEPNSVYVIAPNVQMAIAGGILKLTPRGKVRGPTRSIDFFLESLAQDRRERCIGVVLSGTASDGTLGLEAIKAEGGMTLAQDDTAKYDSMPRSAIAAGCVDFVLSPKAIAAELARIAKHPFVINAPAETPSELLVDPERGAARPEELDAAATAGEKATPSPGPRRTKLKRGAETKFTVQRQEGFKKILLLLRNHSGVDFSLYKSNTIQRRVMRRLVLNQRQTLAEYAEFLKGNTKELDALYSDVLIGVTSFFRNPEAFDTLKRIIFPKLLAQRGRDEPVRIWVIGCSSGQEAYSLAIAFAEAATDEPRTVKLQIFATDLNDGALEKARHGLYTKSLAQDISPERLRRFFVEEEGGWRVTKALREQVVFARQNVTSDPPFSRIDLITCRNVLIYLETELQKKIFPAFHYALKPGGFLFLGASESIGQFTELFAAADKKQKIFAKNAAPTPSFRLAMPSARATPSAPGHKALASPAFETALPDGVHGGYNAQREADRISVSQFAPPGVLINAEGQVLQFRGATGAYLEPSSGKASFDVLKMAREGLLLPLRAAIAKAKRGKQPVRREGVRLRENESTRTVTLRVIPLHNLKETCFLILFEDSEVSGKRTGFASAPAPVLGRRETASRMVELEGELAETRDYLQSIQEQNEAGTEELQASSEEVQSANEELQSINEELETSKEELESTNEELTTINDEMVSRNLETNRLNADLNNLQLSIQTAILLLARDLTIRRFTPPAAKIFNLLATDLGRSVAGIRHNLDLPDLEILLLEVIDTMSLREREVRDKQGRWYGLRARPYLTLDNKIDGVVVVLSDIDDLKRTESAVKAGRSYAEAILRAAPVPFLVLRADLRVDSASEAFYRNFEVTPAETDGRLVYELGNGQWNITQLRALLEKVRTQQSVISDLEVTHEFRTIGRRTMLLHAHRIDGATGAPELILLAIEDITERKRVDDARVAADEFNRAVLESSPDCLKLLDREGRLQFMNVNGQCLLEIEDFAPLKGQAWTSLWPAQYAPLVMAALEKANRGEAARFQAQSPTAKGKLKWWDVIVAPVVAGVSTDHPTGSLISVSRDLTDLKAVEDALRASEERFRNLADNIAQLAWICDRLGDIT
jgi:two-component system CheB/CheR fusion protein